MGLISRVAPIAALTAERKAEMLRLFRRYYANVDEGVFLADLAEKHWVILLLDRHTDEVCGFSTQMLMEMELDGAPMRGLFSGDTIVAREHWGDVGLSRTWGRFVLQLLDQGAAAPLFWLLASKGYKTYRYLPLFFHEFYPRYDAPMPEWARRVLDAFARRKYALGYDASTGLVRAGAGKERLRAGVAEPTAARLRDPHVRFFAARNAQHRRGDELCCLAPLTRENFTAAAYRVMGGPAASEV